MYNIAKLVASLTEGCSLLLWFHILFKRKIDNSFPNIYFTLLYASYFFVVDYVKGFFWEIILPGIIMFFYVYVVFQEKIFTTVVKFLLALVGLSLVQLLSLEVMYIFNANIHPIGIRWMYIIAGIVSVGISAILYLLRNGKSIGLAKPDKYSVSVILYLILILLFIKWDYLKYDGAYSYFYIILYLLLALFVMGMVKELNTKHKLQEKQLELALREQYEAVYKGLLEEMRLKQHDYKNQIIALKSMGLDKDNDREHNQCSYEEQLLERDRFDGLLLSCENSVLSGYVYTQCSNVERHGIKIYPALCCENREYRIPLHEIIQILGILIDNAIEYLCDGVIKDKKMRLKLQGKEGTLNIEVANVSERIAYNEIEEMFTRGFSTKGEGRGLGLFSLKNIVEKYEGNLLVENQSVDGVNWLSIKITI